MIKYWIDMDTTGTLGAEYTETDPDTGDTYLYPGTLQLDYPISIIFTSTTYFKTFCENCLLDGEDCTFLRNTKDSLKQLSIPAGVYIENWSSTSFPYVKIVQYKANV